MKSFFKSVLIGFNTLVIIMIGVWGYNTERSETSIYWQIAGWIVSLIVMFVPMAEFWHDKIKSLFESED